MFWSPRLLCEWATRHFCPSAKGSTRAKCSSGASLIRERETTSASSSTSPTSSTSLSKNEADNFFSSLAKKLYFIATFISVSFFDKKRVEENFRSRPKNFWSNEFFLSKEQNFKILLLSFVEKLDLNSRLWWKISFCRSGNLVRLFLVLSSGRHR